MTVSHTLDRIPEQDSQLCAISQILNLRNDGSLSLMDSYYYQKILWNRRHAFPLVTNAKISCHIIITLLMPQNNDEHGGSGRNFLQVVSSRMAAVSSTALELLSKSGRWILLILETSTLVFLCFLLEAESQVISSDWRCTTDTADCLIALMSIPFISYDPLAPAEFQYGKQQFGAVYARRSTYHSCLLVSPQ
ncbi:hypothetical protein T01_2718 [Trichinella spiralis]|uniref:Uncharacterized protein n=1 Tax=Trichinella spiralis TaxID=6334 RepID=A0A0V1BYT4_TRISP|nr:hypothetical protein T01_2718 [Trichinella spiralis]